jgi:hypothetical protein
MNIKASVNSEEVHLPHRAHNGNEAPVFHWGQLDFGRIALPKGSSDLMLTVAGGNVDIKTLLLEI